MRFNSITIPVLLLFIVLFTLPGCEYTDTELSLKGKLDITGVEGDIRGPVIVGVANTDDLEYIMANPQDAVEIMVPVETLDYRFNIDLAETSLKAGDEVTVFAFADNNYDGGIPMPDEGDMFGMYIDESSFATTVMLNSGSTYVEFAPNRDYYEHDASLTFEISPGAITLNGGENIIVVAVHNSGVDSNYNISIDHVIAMTEVTYQSGNPYTMKILPAIYYEIPVDDPFGIDNVHVFSILDQNNNHKPDSGEPIGFHSLFGIAPVTTSIENGSNTLDYSVRFTSYTY